MEGFVQADKLAGGFGQHGIDQGLVDVVFQMHQQGTFGDGKQCVTGQLDLLHFFRGHHAGLDQQFVEQVFLAGVGVDVIDVEFHLLEELFVGDIFGGGLPEFEVALVEF